MTPLSAKALYAGNVWQNRPIQLSHSADHAVRGKLLPLAVLVDGIDDPKIAFLIELGSSDLGVESEVILQRMILDDALKVFLQFILLGKVLAPVVRRFKGVTVQMIADINACAGIPVFEPGTAYRCIFLNNDKRDTRLLQSIGRQYA